MLLHLKKYTLSENEKYSVGIHNTCMDYKYYETINKPSYAPQKKVFTVVWTFLYILMGISYVILYFSPTTFNKFFSMPVFYLQLLLNILWPFIFFKFKKIAPAFVISILLFLTVLMMTKLFFGISIILGIFQIPYLLWLAFAVKLNFDIMKLN